MKIFALSLIAIVVIPCLLAMVIAAIPFASLILIINMCCNGGSIDFRPKRSRPGRTASRKNRGLLDILIPG